MSERNGDKARFAKAKKKRLRHRENMKELASAPPDRPVRPGGARPSTPIRRPGA